MAEHWAIMYEGVAQGPYMAEHWAIMHEGVAQGPYTVPEWRLESLFFSFHAPQ